MSPHAHPAADVLVLSLTTVLIAPVALPAFGPAALIVRLLLGGYAPGPWRWASLPFTLAGAVTVTAVVTASAPVALGLLWLAGGAGMAIVQMATRIASLRVVPAAVRSVSRRA